MKIIGALTLILITISGVLYSNKGYSRLVKYMLYSGVTLGVIYFVGEILPVIIFFILVAFNELFGVDLI